MEYFINSVSIPNIIKIDTKDLKKEIESLDKDGQYNILSLVRHYELLYSNDSTFVPYNGKISDKGITLYIDNLPDKLLYLMYKFSKLYVSRKLSESRNQIKSTNKIKSK